MMSSLGKQLTRFMGNLPYIQKFAALIIVFCIPLIVCCTLLYTEYKQRIAFTERELHGSEYLNAISSFQHILYHLEFHPYQTMHSHKATNVDHETNPQILLKTASDRFYQLQQINDRHGETLAVNHLFIDIEKLWMLYKQNLIDALKPSDWQRTYTFEFHRELGKLVRKIGDNSNLILDPHLGSYYLMTTVLITLRDIQTTLIEIERAFHLEMEYLKKNSSAPSYAYQKQQEAIILLKDNQLKLVRELYTAFEHSDSEQTEQTIAPKVKEIEQLIQELIPLLRTSHKARSAQIIEIDEQLTQTIDKSFLLWDTTNRQLQHTLSERIEATHLKFVLFTITTLVALTIAIALIYGFYQSVIKTVLYLDQATSLLLKGNLEHPIEIHTKDELSLVVRGFNQIMIRLKAEWLNARAETDRARQAELEAQAEHEKSRTLALIASRTTNGIIITDRNGRVQWLNDGFEYISGYSLADMQGKKPGEVLQGEDTCQDTVNRIRAMIQAQQGVEADLINYKKNGEKYWVHLNIQPLFNEHGLVDQFMAIESDITERKHIEQALQKSEKLFKGIFNSAPDCVIGVDSHNKILFANPATEVLFGYEQTELIHFQLDKLLPRENRKQHWQYMKRFSENALPQLQMTNRQVNALKKDGSQFPIEVSISKVQLDDQVIFTAILRDVTQQRKYEKQLQDAVAVTKSILDASTLVAMIATNPEGIVTVFNSGAEKMLGYQADEFIGVQTPAILHEEEEVIQRGKELSEELGVPIEGFETFVALARRGKYEEREWTYVRKNGERLTVSLSITAIRNSDDDITGFLGVAKDITESRLTLERLEEETQRANQLAEQAKAANIAKSQFLANMSHEIRTPMNGVLGMSQLLKLTKLDHKQQEYLGAIQSSGEMLLTVLNDILDFSKIEAGKLTIEAIEFDLFKEITQIAKLFNSLADNKGLELILKLPVSGARYFRGDITRIKQVITNLVSNAIKFTTQGHILMEVSVTASAQNNHRVEVSVHDTGIGIPKAKLKGLFQEFTQVDASTTRKYGGTGLGLSISRKLIELMGGQLHADSKEGHGSRFWFELELPDAPAALLDHSQRNKTTLAGMAQLKDLDVLVIDDNEINLTIFEEHLLHWQMRPVTCNESSRLFNEIQHQDFDLLILDYMMPEVSGADIIQRIRAEDHAFPIVLVSSADVEHLNLREDPNLRYLMKPLDADHLLDELVNLVTHQSPHQQKPDDQHSEPSHSFSGRVLLVEDTLINQMLGQELLNKLGLTVDLAENGQEALEMVIANQYDLVFMDCLMPVMDGYQSTRKIRISEADSDRHTPICALTANALDDAKYKCQAAGMDDFVSKPFKHNELIGVLTKWLTVENQNSSE
ncbi:PAS domain S-box protein [Litoribrevibacter euphylliae]|uniref:histidine kinase n=1 Tax=Litoribrevibacter euphylliae TaxID=1834034 RepID=A0ABV7HJU3_9GAMM